MNGSKASRFAAAVTTIALFFALAAASASAEAGGYLLADSFGTAGSGKGQLSTFFSSGIGIDQTTGDVYVADTYSARILKFSATGDFIAAWGYGVADGTDESQVCTDEDTCQVGIPGNGPGQFAAPVGIAVDNSDGPNKGDVYVLDADAGVGGIPASNHYAMRFSSSGVWEHKIDGSDTPSGAYSSIDSHGGSIAVDGSGYVWIGGDGDRIDKYSNQTSNAYVGGSEWEVRHFGLAVNSTGSKLLILGFTGGNYGSYIVNSNGTAPGDGLGCGSYFNSVAAYAASTDRWYVGNGGSVCEFDAGGQRIGTIGQGDISGAAGIAVNDTTGRIYVLDASQQKIDVFTVRIVPDVTTGPPSSVGHTDATLTGSTAPDSTGGGDVSDCYFEYGPTTSYGSMADCDQQPPFSGSTDVTAHLTGLTQEQKYHYRLVTSNSIGANQGDDMTFTPHAVLGTTTEPPTDLTPTTATLNASFDPNGTDTDYYFEWGTDTTYGNTTEVQTAPGSPSGTGTFSAEIDGLTNFTVYHYRVVATNNFGTSYGEDQVFTSATPYLPIIANTSASGISGTGATVSADISPGFGNTVFLFEYGPSTGYGRVTDTSDPIGSDNSPHPVQTQLSGLNPGTTYHYRAVAINFGGTSHGPDMTFTTPDKPRVDSSFSSAVTQTTATLGARITPNLSPTTYHFEYGLTPLYGNTTPESGSIGADTFGHGASAAIAGLAPGTLYHYRVVATNGVGTSAGPDQTLITAAAPKPAPPAPPALRCKKGFVKKHGKCVKRKRRHHKHKKHRRHHKKKHHAHKHKQAGRTNG